jgi:molybdopterin converting factor small subunit
MSVRVRAFYPELQRLAGSPGEIRVDGDTVGECLHDLVRQYPDVERLLFDARGELLKHVYVYVNAESMYKADLARAVTDRDELLLAVLATAG